MTDISLPQSAPSGEYLTGIDEKGSIVTKAIELQEVETDAFFGGTTTSTSENTIGLTLQTYALDSYDGKIVENTAVEFVAPDPDCCQWGVVTKVDTTNVTPAAIDVIMMGCSRLTGTYGGANGVWKIRILNPAGPDAALLAYSSTSTALAAGDITFTIQANKFMPINGSVFIQALGVPSVRGWAKVKVYTGTSLIVTLPANGVFGSGTYTAWAIFLVDGAPAGVPLYSLNGLRVTVNSGNTAKFDITSGSVRDSTDALDLVLSSATTKDMSSVWAAGTGNGACLQSAVLSGTGTSTTNHIVGTGTAFLSDFSVSATLSDWTSQYGGTYSGPASVICSATNTAKCDPVTNVASDTSLFTTGNLNFSSETYKRGGPAFTNTAYYGIVIMRKDDDGSVEVGATSFTVSGAPDLPSGYTYYRVIAVLKYSASSIIGSSILQALYPSAAPIGIDYFIGTADSRLAAARVPTDTTTITWNVATSGQFKANFTGSGYVPTTRTVNGHALSSNVTVSLSDVGAAVQSDMETGTSTSVAVVPGVQHYHPAHPKAVGAWTITGTAVTGSVSAVNASTDVVTWSTNHGLTTGNQIRGIGTVPAGWTVAQAYYVNVPSATTFTLHLTLADAIAGTNKVDITATTTGATIVKYVLSSPSVAYGFNSSCPVGLNTGTTTLGLEFNLSPSLSSGVAVANFGGANIVDNSGSSRLLAQQSYPSSIATNLIKYSDLRTLTSSTIITTGTLVQQGTTAFQASLMAWGDL